MRLDTVVENRGGQKVGPRTYTCVDAVRSQIVGKNIITGIRSYRRSCSARAARSRLTPSRPLEPKKSPLLLRDAAEYMNLKLGGTSDWAVDLSLGGLSFSEADEQEYYKESESLCMRLLISCWIQCCSACRICLFLC